MKHLVGLFSVLICILAIVIPPYIGATAQDLSTIIFSLAWSPDGSKIAVGKFSEIEILDAKNLALLTTLTGSNGAISAVDWSADSSKVAAASGGHEDGLNVWNVSTGQIIATRSVAAIAVKWNPDQVSIVTASTGGGIGIWNISTNEVVLPSLFGSTMDWSPDGSKLVNAHYDEAPITVTDILIGETLFTLPGHVNGVEDVDWSPDGTKIASGGGYDNIVQIWNATTGASLFALTGHTNVVSSVAWNPNNISLASGSSDGSVRFWDSETGELRHIVEASGQVRAISWSPDGSKIAYGGDEGILHVVPASLLQTPIPSATMQSEAQTLRDLLSDPNCQSACFMGIEPGVTTQAELEILLGQYQLKFTQSSIASGHLILYTASPQSSPFLADDKPVYIDVTADHVDLVTLFLQDVTLAQITDEYGALDGIVGGDETSKFIIYAAEGLIFATASPDTDSIGRVFLTPPGRDALRINAYLSESAPCSGSVSVCAIATATATPTPTATSAFPTNTPRPTVVATATLSLQTIFPAPMDIAVTPRLSSTNADSHSGSIDKPLCSRDINKSSFTGGNWGIVSSGTGTAIIRGDAGGVAGANKGLGNVLIVQFPFNTLPLEIQNLLKQRYPQIASLANVQQGYLYVAYGHLYQINVNEGQSLSVLTSLGLSGKTGLENAIPAASEHLDVSVYYAVEGPDAALRADPRQIGVGEPFDWYFSLFILDDSKGIIRQAIDPIILWPLIIQGSVLYDPCIYPTGQNPIP